MGDGFWGRRRLRWKGLLARIGVALLGALLSLTVARSLARATPPAPAVSRGGPLHASKKGGGDGHEVDEALASGCSLATLDETHSRERLLFDCASPSLERFSVLLRDRIVGQTRELDPRLLGLLRELVVAREGARVELVSGYRSPKRNEMMRKKGRHVASHSQHSFGHAVDFRVVPKGAKRGVDPRDLEREIRALGWKGGVGVYTLATDWFVHADVGRERRWGG